MNWIFNKIDFKWIGSEQKWIGSRKLDFLPTPSFERANFRTWQTQNNKENYETNYLQVSMLSLVLYYM